MKVFNIIQQSGLAEALASAVLNSLWQGFVIGMAVLLIVMLAKSISAKVKYAISYIGLLTITALFALTFSSSYINHVEKEALRVVENQQVNRTTAIKAINKVTSSYALLNPSKAQIDKMSSNRTMAAAILFVWIAGVMFFILKFFGEFLYINRLKKSLKNPKGGSYVLDELSRKLSKRLGIKRNIRIMNSVDFKIPSVLGFFKPIIILPMGLINGLSTEQVEAVILHELAHIKRKDYLLNIIQKLIETLMFYHPVVWILSSYIRDEREKCCDDIVIEATGNKKDYACALGYVQMHAAKRNPKIAMALAGNKNKILYRMKRIIETPYHKSKRLDGLFAAIFLAIGILAIVFSTNTISANNKQKDVIHEDDTVIVKRKKLVTLVYTDTIGEKKKDVNVTLNNDKIEELYIDGKKIKEKDFPKYEKMVAKHVDEIELDGAEKEIIVEKTIIDEDEEKTIIVGNAHYDRQVDVENFQRQMTELSVEISEKVKEMDIENTFDDDFVKKMEKFGMEMGKLGAEIGLKVAEAVNSIPWDSIGIEIDEKTREDMRRDLENAREEIKEELKELERTRKENKDVEIDEIEYKKQQKIAEKNRIEADKQKQIAQEQQRIAVEQAQKAEKQRMQAYEQEMKAKEELQKEIDQLKIELEKVKKQLEEQKTNEK